MLQANAKIAEDIEAYLHEHEHKSLLRFITCGSVDDGKSTLIGRLLYESKLIFEDQLDALKSESKKVGTQGDDIDFALLVDGLAAEREQGITIDVAYRFFTTDKRKFIVADTPGHEQYTRNMATGASTADLAIILIDARKGILPQTRRHSYIVSMMGIRHVVLAVNKMDMVDYDQQVFNDIHAAYKDMAKDLDIEDITCIPMSALKGDNIIEPSANMAWHDGAPLMKHLEDVNPETSKVSQNFRMPVQWVNRPDLDFRGFCGQVTSGAISAGAEVVAMPSGKRSKLARIVHFDGDKDTAVAGESVTLTLEDEIDVSRGDVLCAGNAPMEKADQFEVKLIWMAEEPMLPGRSYLLKIGTKTTHAMITDAKYKVNINSYEQMPAKSFELNDIGVCNISTTQMISVDAFADSASTGSFILIDRLNNTTVGAGTINFALRRASNIHWQSLDVNKDTRAEMKHQKAQVVWLTGLSGAGKSTIANLVEKRLHADGKHTFVLDGDNVRHGLCRDLGFADADRVENIRRVSEVAKLMVESGLIVIVSFISPFRSERRMARRLFEEGEYSEVLIDAPLSVVEQRDPKGLYKKARAGEIPNFTGIDSPYEPPVNPELVVHTDQLSAEEAADLIIEKIINKA